MSNDNEHKWTFRRLGGLDQVVLGTAEDFKRIGELDPKLWVALSCPISGLEFDARTLSLIDTDKDGRIRIPELIAAAQWAAARLKNPAALAEGRAVLYLDDIEQNTGDETVNGARLVATAHAMLDSLGKTPEQGLTREDIDDCVAHAAENLFNGDGVLAQHDKLDPAINAFIADAQAVIGAVADAGGAFGINKAIAEAFIQTLENWILWQKEVAAAENPLGIDLASAWPLLQELKPKIDDYFLRAELAAYAPQAQNALNVDEAFIVPSERGLISGPALAELPLAAVRADAPLNLRKGLNPEWRGRMLQFFGLVAPLLERADNAGTAAHQTEQGGQGDQGDQGATEHRNRTASLTCADYLCRENWLKIVAYFEAYSLALEKKPALTAPLETELGLAPMAEVDALGRERIEELLGADLLQEFLQLADQDAAVPASALDIADVERLMLYNQHLYRLLMNFVSFADFYAPQHKAAFQTGTLYIDGRSCSLCLPVADVGKHTALASFSRLYLIYCECTRKTAPGLAAPAEKRSIVAAVTAGDSEFLMDNRNGVFIDNQGQDWDATVLKIVANPISLWQAVWDPYRRFARMIGEQINKFAGSKDAALTSMVSQKLDVAVTAAQTAPAAAASPGAVPAAVAFAPTPSAPVKFDIGRSVGIFAAIGLAIGAIGTALASIAQALFSLQWWQLPLVFVGLFLLISGPSVILAWLKLRERALGPLLEASGWAVNGKVRINLYLGKLLTATAQLPPGSSRRLADPLQKSRKWPWLVFMLAVIAGAAAAGIYFWR